MNVTQNFGKNVRFVAAEFHEPSNEAELLRIIRTNAHRKIRVMGSLHSWSPVIQTDGVLVSMRHFDSVEIHETDQGPFARIGAGCQIKHILTELAKHGLTLPAIGLITEQTIAGATATATHGSGRHCLSHYLRKVRIACFRDSSNEPQIREITDGDELRAAKCSLGCMGIVVEVELPCVPQYRVHEAAAFHDTIEEVLASEQLAPLQQAYLFPHLWRFGVHARNTTDEAISRSAWLYRIYKWLGIDVALHLLIKLSASVLRSRTLIHFLYRRLLPWFVFTRWHVIDQSDRILTMEHELFRHLELEAFVPRRHLPRAIRRVEEILKQADGSRFECDRTCVHDLERAELTDEFQSLRGTYTHHYPICIRRIRPDDTFISMSSGGSEDWYAISLITYVEPREPFYRVARLIAKVLRCCYQGRIHWGKWFPLERSDVEQMYPELDRFRELCQQFDPEGAFQNEFTRRVIGFETIGIEHQNSSAG